jgi:hypothetical protein
MVERLHTADSIVTKVARNENIDLRQAELKLRAG